MPETDSQTAKEDDLLTIIVPCLNEEGAIAETIADILAVAPTLPMPIKIWMVDDGSTDNTRAVMESLCERHPECNMRVNPRNMGIGRTVLSTYEVIDPSSWVTVIPGDNEFRFESIHNFMKLRHDHDVVLGYFGNPIIRTFTRRMASNAFRSLACLLYGYNFRYLNGMKMYRLWAFEGIEVKSGGFAYNAELVAKAILRNPNLRIGEAPFVARGRAAGSTTAFKPKAILRAVRELNRGVQSVHEYRLAVIRAEDS